ncbi:hypothetical protein Tco_0702178 [Tanacetum coccineum]|uniref:Uncharacterized protein n=1 Tax=Tanacetum coccineum TaxID=301880 RepID=A0ABQ4XWK7_9ASTR
MLGEMWDCQLGNLTAGKVSGGGGRSVETEFPAIVFDDTFTSEVTHSCKPMVSPPNDNKIDFRISFDESDDEDYTPTVSYFNDLDFFKDFKNEFLAIVYNDALTSKSDFLTELTISPQHIDEFDLKIITEYLVNISKRRTFWSLNEDILKINYSEDQYAVSIKKDTARRRTSTREVLQLPRQCT